MRALTVALCLILGLLLAPSLAFGDDNRARELFENGARLYDEGLYDDAITAWQEAYRLSPDRHLLLFNMANAYERLGRYQEALDHLNRYRALAPKDERETLERRIRAIERRMAELKERAAKGSDVDPLLDTSGSQLTVTSTSSAKKGGGDGPHPAGIALLAGGGAGLAVGGIFGGLALNERASAQSLCVVTAGDATLCPTEAKEHIDQDRTYSAVGDIAMIAGGVALGAGVIVLVVEATGGGGQANNLRVLPSVGPGGAAVTFEGRF